MFNRYVVGDAPMWRIIEAGHFRIDVDTYRVAVRNQQVRLTPKEFKLLLYLAKHTGHIITHHKLVLAIWSEDTGGQRERLRVLIGQLRKKIERGEAPQYIVTEPWIGYRFEPAGELSLHQLQEQEVRV